MEKRKINNQRKKTAKLITLLAFILISSPFLNSCSEDVNPENGIENNEMATAPLSEVEKNSLAFMREEEMLARDVYSYLYERWGLVTFNNIANSEQSHTEAVLALLNKYKINDPVGNNEAGVFTNPDLQQLYSTLISQGSQSLLDALIVGATIEDLDISDLNEAILVIENSDIIITYENLNKGSRNHMRSFYEQIQIHGGSYEPQFISKSEFEAIISSSIERGKG